MHEHRQLEAEDEESEGYRPRLERRIHYLTLLISVLVVMFAPFHHGTADDDHNLALRLLRTEMLQHFGQRPANVLFV